MPILWKEEHTGADRMLSAWLHLLSFPYIMALKKKGKPPYRAQEIYQERLRHQVNVGNVRQDSVVLHAEISERHILENTRRTTREYQWPKPHNMGTQI